MAYQEQRRLDEAIACYERAISLRPDHAEAHANLGAAFLMQEQLDRANAVCQKAISLKPDLAAAHFNLGLALQDLKRLEEAVACFEKVLAIKPDHKRAFSALAWTQAMGCDWRERGVRMEALRAQVREGRSVVEPFAFLATCPDPGEQKLCAERYLADEFPESLAAPYEGDKVRHDKVRVVVIGRQLVGPEINDFVARRTEPGEQLFL